jgi:hypothetical protein
LSRSFFEAAQRQNSALEEKVASVLEERRNSEILLLDLTNKLEIAEQGINELREENSRLLTLPSTRLSSPEAIPILIPAESEELKRMRQEILAAHATASAAAAEIERRGSEIENLKTALRNVENENSLPRAASGDSLPALVQSQRDRFRARALELESERDALLRQVQGYKHRAEELYADNCKLVEQKRYWQGAGAWGEFPDDFTHDGRYTNEKKKEFPIPDFLRHPTARSVLVAYFAIVHLVIFFCIWRLAASVPPQLTE